MKVTSGKGHDEFAELGDQLNTNRTWEFRRATRPCLLGQSVPMLKEDCSVPQEAGFVLEGASLLPCQVRKTR